MKYLYLLLSFILINPVIAQSGSTGIFEKNGFKIISVTDYNVLTRERVPGVWTDYTQFLLIARRSE